MIYNDSDNPSNDKRTNKSIATRRLARTAKSLVATLLFVRFSKAFDSIHRGKMVQILLAYCLSKETVATIMMLYSN